MKSISMDEKMMQQEIAGRWKRLVDAAHLPMSPAATVMSYLIMGKQIMDDPVVQSRIGRYQVADEEFPAMRETDYVALLNDFTRAEKEALCERLARKRGLLK